MFLGFECSSLRGRTNRKVEYETVPSYPTVAQYPQYAQYQPYQQQFQPLQGQQGPIQKIFGLLKPPTQPLCGPKGCNKPEVHIHNHNGGKFALALFSSRKIRELRAKIQRMNCFQSIAMNTIITTAMKAMRAMKATKVTEVTEATEATEVMEVTKVTGVAHPHSLPHHPRRLRRPMNRLKSGITTITTNIFSQSILSTL